MSSRSESGQVVVMAALVLTVMSIALALVVDIGNAKQTGANLQSAADAAALAGASQLSTSVSTAETYAEEYAFDSLNQARGSTVTCPSDAPVPGTTVCYQTGSGPIVYVTTPYTQSPPASNGSNPPSADQINIKICSTVNTTFARVINVTSLRACDTSTADVTGTSNNLPCGVCVISGGGEMGNSLKVALEVTGNVPSAGVPNIGVTVSGGTASGIVVESAASGSTATTAAAVLTGSTQIKVTGGTINITGSHYAGGTSTYSPAPTSNTVSGDPLASVAAPSVAGSASAFVSDATQSSQCGGTINPGVYSSILVEGMTCPTNNPNLVMNTGVYVIEGAFNVSAGTIVQGNNVTLYFTCSAYSTSNTSACTSPGQSGGYFTDNNNGTAMFTAPTTGTYAGLSMFYDRNDYGAYKYPGTDCGTPFVGNSATVNDTGTVYAKDAQICIEGNTSSFDSLFVVGAIAVEGSSGLSDVVNSSQQVNLSAPTMALTG